MEIRLASLDDVKGIVEVHCSDVEKWFRVVGGRRVEADYGSLSVGERFLHGGPWMSIETCAIHLNYLLISKQYPLVAIADGKVVGELELFICSEDNVLGKTAFIDILVVHKDYRRKGIGRALINYARRLAVKRECDTLSVWPEEKAIPFYRKCGLSKEAYKVIHVVINLEELKSIELLLPLEPFPRNYKLLEDMVFISPRFFPSYVAWVKSSWEYALKEHRFKVLDGFIPTIGAFIVEEYWKNRREAVFKLWVEHLKLLPVFLKILGSLARERGYIKAHLYVEEGVFDTWIKPLKAETKEKHVILYEKLR
ncbi:MAG TPA: N-acetyltransferase [Thermoproteales archaeon]|nr:N-acetyltransferase [Thermoproteales archaeon]